MALEPIRLEDIDLQSDEPSDTFRPETTTRFDPVNLQDIDFQPTEVDFDAPVRSRGVPFLRPRPEEEAGRITIPEAPEERNILETFGAGVRRGFIGEGVGLGRGVAFVGEVVGSRKVAELGEGLAEFSQGVLDRHPEWAAAKEQSDRAWFHPERLTETVAEAIPMMATFMLPGGLAAKGLRLAGAAPKAARAAGAVIAGTPFGLVSAGEMFDKAREEGVDETTAKWLAGTAGVLEVGLELFGASKVINMMGLDKLSKEGMRQAVTKTEAIKNIARSAGELSLIEGLEEFSQTIKDNLITKFGIDEGQAVFEGGLQSAVVGGILGGLTGGGARSFGELTAIPRAEEKAEMPEIQALPKEVAERIVADQTIPAKAAKDVATYFANELPPTKSAEESARAMDDLLNEAGIGVTTDEVQDLKGQIARGVAIGEEAVTPGEIDVDRLNIALNTPPFQRTAEDRLEIQHAMKQDVDIDIASVFTGRQEVREPVSPIESMTESLETKLEAKINTIEPTTDLGNELLDTIKEQTVRDKVSPVVTETSIPLEAVTGIPTTVEELPLPEAAPSITPEVEIPIEAKPGKVEFTPGRREQLESIRERATDPESIKLIDRALQDKFLKKSQQEALTRLEQAEIAEEPIVTPEIAEEKPVTPKEAPKRVRIGKSPQPHKVIKELEATPEEIELGERFFEVENEKTGEVSTVSLEDMTPIKEIITEEMRDKAKKNIKSKLGRLTAGIDPTLLKDYAVIGAFHFERGLRTFSAWGKKMIEEFDDGIKPHLNDLWARAKAQVPEDAEVIAPEKPVKKPVEKKAEKPIKPKKPEVKAPTKKKPTKIGRTEELRRKFEKDLTKPTMDETLELAEREKKLPKKKFGDHREYSGREKAALSKIGIKPENRSVFTKINELRENLGTNIRQKIVDQYASLKGVSEQGYILAIMSNTSTGALEAIIQHGELRLTKDGAITVDETGKGLANALTPLGVELDDFFGWVAGNRAKSLKGQDRERLFSDEDIKALIALSDGKMEDGRHRKTVYKRALRDLNTLHKSIVDMSVETGTINSEERDSWNQDFYVPFFRVLEEAEGIKGPRTLDALAGQTAIKRLKGADVPLNDMLQNILMNWNHLINSSLKNQAGIVSLEASEKQGAASQIKERDKTKNSVFARKDGKKVWYDVHDPLILESISALSWEGFDSRMMKAMRKFKRALTLGVTISPEFRIANLMRDTIHSVAVGKLQYNMFDNVFGKGWSGTKKDSLVNAKTLAGGGQIHFGHQFGADPEAAKLLIQKGIKKETILDNPTDLKRFTGIFHKAWDSWNEVGSRLENINRAALYQNRVKEVGELRANFEARDLMNFTNSGAASSIRFLTQVVPFLNARMQGLDKMGRAFADKEQRKQFVMASSGVALASIALYLAFKDDDDFKEREQWDRDTYWWFKLPGSDIAYRIPKPFEVGAIGTMAERMVEQIADDEVHGKLFAERFAHMVAETFSFSIVPQMIKPTLDVYANKNPFTDRPIETIGLQRLSPTERKRAWTSETAIGLSQAMDKVSWGKVVLSPIQVEFLIQGYLGWLGAASLATVDQIFTRPIGDFPVEPTKRIDDYPAIGRFVRSNPQRNTKYATLFYEQLQEMNEAHNDIQNFRKLGELEKAEKLKNSKIGQLKLRKYFNAVQRKLGKINRRMKKIHASRDMTAQEKRNEIDLLTVQKNRLVRIAAEKTKFVK